MKGKPDALEFVKAVPFKALWGIGRVYWKKGAPIQGKDLDLDTTPPTTSLKRAMEKMSLGDIDDTKK